MTRTMMQRALSFTVCAAVMVITLEARAAKIFETTFDCADWDQKMGIADKDVCATGDGIGGHGAWATSTGAVDRITALANNPSGAGGKGFRHYRNDGTNNNGGGLGITLPTAVREMWLRFYMRYERGFAWAMPGQPHYTKDIYMNVSQTRGNFVLGFDGTDRWGLTMVNPGTGNLRASPGWQTINGGPTGDGLFHCYETHVRWDTNGSNGVAESWVDGKQNYSVTTHNFGTTGAWTYFAVGENQNTPANGGADMYTDYDDIAISTSGPIGCFAAPSDAQAPSDAGNAPMETDATGAVGPERVESDHDAPQAADARASADTGCRASRGRGLLPEALIVGIGALIAGRLRARRSLQRRVRARTFWK